jgi:hypothetical protein
MSHITWFEPVWWRLFPITCCHFFSSICHLFFIVLSYCPCNFLLTHSLATITLYVHCSLAFLLEISAVEDETNTLSYVQEQITQWHCMIFFSVVQQPLVGQDLLIIKASRSHSNTPHSVGLLWMSGQPNAETCTWQHKTLIRHRHPCLWCDSNPQSQQVSGHRYTP